MHPVNHPAIRCLHDVARALLRSQGLEDNADVFVFTLGLTEGWASKGDGSVYPLAPGVTAGSYSADAYEFINLSVYEVDASRQSITKVKALPTVSLVPLIATYANRHVLSATTYYSKSMLRVAAETLTCSCD